MATYEEQENMISKYGDNIQKIKNKISIRVFNKRNLPFGISYTDIPHIKKLDLILTYSVERKTYMDNEKGIECYLIKNNDLERWNITEDELHEIAINNIKRKNNFRIETIAEHVMRFNMLNPIIDIPKGINVQIDVKPSSERELRHSLFEHDQYSKAIFQDFNINKELDNSDLNVLVLCNRNMNFGATSFFLDNALSEVYDKFDENYYILPVSVHELLCVKKSFAMKNSSNVHEAEENLLDMVEQINDMIITEDEDILSYNIYYYMHDDNCMMMIKN